MRGNIIYMILMAGMVWSLISNWKKAKFLGEYSNKYAATLVGSLSVIIYTSLFYLVLHFLG